MKFYPFLCALLLCVAAIGCAEKPGKISVQNSIRGVVISDVRWGDIFITDQLLPGEASNSITVYDAGDDSYGVNLPTAYPIRFYMEVQGDRIYLETRESYKLDVEEDIDVILYDSTRVFNPLLEAN